MPTHTCPDPLQVELLLIHAALIISWGFWAMLRFLPWAKTRGSQLQGLQISIFVTLLCWGLPATAREKCLLTSSPSMNPSTDGALDVNLLQALFFALSYAAISARSRVEPEPRSGATASTEG